MNNVQLSSRKAIAAGERPSLALRDGRLREHWYIACLSGELPAGRRVRPLGRVIYDRGLVLFRDARGHPVCLPDRCLHRNALLSGGVVLDGRLACAYHGWTYDGRGRVIDVPSEGPAGAGAQPRCLAPLPCVEQDGCVWVWMGSAAPQPVTPPLRFPYRAASGWSQYFMVTDFDNEVTNLIENFMDVPHTVFVHAGWFRSRRRRAQTIRVDTSGSEVLVTYDDAQDAIGCSGRLLNPRDEPVTHTDRFVMPNLTRVDYAFGADRGFSITSQCTPVSVLRTRVYTAIAYKLRRPGLSARLLQAAVAPLLRAYTRKVIRQDVAIMANQGESLRRDPQPDFHGTGADLVHEQIELLRERGRQGWAGSVIPSRMERQIWI